jgi:hypothetical protein
MPSKVKNFAAQFALAELGHVMLRNVIKEQIARRGVEEIRKTLQEYSEQAWNSEELLAEFEVSHFDPPYVHVIRKVDGVRGTVAFNDDPRLYFAFRPEGFSK